MADAGEIQTVRNNVAEPDDTNGYTDVVIGVLIDEGSEALASATIWRWKAAKYAELVNVSEAGASRQMSDLFKHAEEMANFWQKQADAETEADSPGIGNAKVHPIERVT